MLEKCSNDQVLDCSLPMINPDGPASTRVTDCPLSRIVLTWSEVSGSSNHWNLSLLLLHNQPTHHPLPGTEIITQGQILLALSSQFNKQTEQPGTLGWSSNFYTNIRVLQLHQRAVFPNTGKLFPLDSVISSFFQMCASIEYISTVHLLFSIMDSLWF